MSAQKKSSQTSRETGQALVIIAMGFVVLLGFTGLVVDVARVFTARAQLRRAVDAAGLAATGQFRQGATGTQIAQAALDLIRAHDITDPNVVIETCGSMDGVTVNNDSLCPPAGKPKRKLVRVSASADVPMVFLQILGIGGVPVNASSVAEAASVDAALILDTSESQAYDAPSAFDYNGTNKGCGAGDVGENNVAACIAACTAHHHCYPLEKTKVAAKAFVDRMYQGYDRVAVVTYDRSATAIYHLGIDLTEAKNQIDNMHVYAFGAKGTCPTFDTIGERWKCGSSNPGGGLMTASHEFANGREDSLWVALFLSSGGLNATDPAGAGVAEPEASFGYCPPKNQADPLSRDGAPPCRDQRWSVHHAAPTTTTASPLYDAEDYAFDVGTYMGLEAQPNGGGGMGVLIYTIALGQKAVCTTGQTYSAGPPVVCGNFNPLYKDLDSGVPNTGELFLRYIAAVGDDGNPATDLCTGIQSGYQCGNYYFAPTSDDLLKIFLEIAGRIFTRISG